MQVLHDYRTEYMERKQCGITQLYNQFFDEPASQLAKLHAQLDELVCKAYDIKANQDPLKFLLELNFEVTGLSPEGALLTRPEVYDFSQGMPAVLQPFCTQTPVALDCRNIRTSARKPGTYQFEMVMSPKPGRGATPETATTKPVTIAPIPQPQILSFTSTQPVYQEISQAGVRVGSTTSASAKQAEIRLNWAIANPNQVQSLQLTGRSSEGAVVSPSRQYDFSQGVAGHLKDFCTLKEQLICQNVPTNARKPGDYFFELVATSKTNAKPATKKTDLIKILPKPSRILEFKLNGKTASAKYVIPILPNQPLPRLLLSWQVEGSQGTKGGATSGSRQCALIRQHSADFKS